jgi:hypothetical protein
LLKTYIQSSENESPHHNKKERNMKTMTTIWMMMALLAAVGCSSTKDSRQGGIAPINEEFSITVPTSNTLKQGAQTSITISLNRGAYFKQDVQLYINTEGISVTPSYVLIKASDSPVVPFQITAARDTAIGEYRVSVKGMPMTGEPTSTVFTVKVLAQ